MLFGLGSSYTLRELQTQNQPCMISAKSLKKKSGLTEILTLTSAMPVDDGYGCL